MKKFSLLLGTLGGAMAGYLFSNKKLREELAAAKDPEDAAKLLGKHLQKDGKKFAKQVQDFVGSEDVQCNIDKAKQYTKKKVDTAKEELKGLISEGKGKAKVAAQKGKAKAKKTVKRATKKATTTARRTSKRVRAKVRKLS